MQPEIIAKLWEFLGSASGGIVVAALIGALGLFTWQRRDWLFKEQYHRNQVLTDRALDLLEKINVDIGMFLAHANDVIALYEKQASSLQTGQEIEDYNKQQQEWFGSCISDSARIGFYFPRKKIAQKFAEIAQTTEDLDRHISWLSTGQKTPLEAYNVAERARSLLEHWKALALSNLPATQVRRRSRR